MNADSDNKRFLRSIALLPVAACALATFAVLAQDDFAPRRAVAPEINAAVAQDASEVVVSTRREVEEPDLNARSDFRIADVVAQEYLVVTVKITADDVVAEEGATLARGPKKANGVVDDLRVKAFKGASVYAEYAMADPRIVRWQAADRYTLGHETEIKASARSKVYIPLSADIDKVIIEPSPNSRPGSSQGGEFDPKPCAVEACRAADRARFPACVKFGSPALGLVVS